ncbi:hypothetical protein COCVIDRAFT_20347 [Bipolaris victoriae FI3]|uniref:Uncharacterized protein n=1 Tax=Bipolaris victoriae (strain FI3) TaxID=930091 RepID=W7E090_BIPV3|nr:hypothetical protein COCVIDRAFT_20347 [Bipolaris victoriae FI3]
METVSKGNQPTRYQTWATAASCPLHGLACACGNRTGQQPPSPKTRELAHGSLWMCSAVPYTDNCLVVLASIFPVGAVGRPILPPTTYSFVIGQGTAHVWHALCQGICHGDAGLHVILLTCGPPIGHGAARRTHWASGRFPCFFRCSSTDVARPFLTYLLPTHAPTLCPQAPWMRRLATAWLVHARIALSGPSMSSPPPSGRALHRPGLAPTHYPPSGVPAIEAAATRSRWRHPPNVILNKAEATAAGLP